MAAPDAAVVRRAGRRAVVVDVRAVAEGPQPRARGSCDARARDRPRVPGAARRDDRARAVLHRELQVVAGVGEDLAVRYVRRATPPSARRGAPIFERQAAKRVALQFVPRRWPRGTIASSAASIDGCAATTARSPVRRNGGAGRLAARGAAQGPDPLRRQGHAPAPDHAHERQAARAGRQQAGAVLRHRGDGRGRHRRGRDHHRARDRATRSGRGRATARASASRSPTSSRTSRSASPTRC